MTYKYETHLHTKGCSKDGKNTGSQMVDKACEMGYSGIVITNHFFGGNTCIDENLSWKDFVGAYENDYLVAKEYGQKCGIDVLFGIEDKYDTGKEILIYGVAPSAIAQNTDYPKLSLEEKSAFIRENGGITVCAHPYRVRDRIPYPDRVPSADLLDGAEVYNSHNNRCENGKATAFAVKNSLLPFSGGDTHIAEKFGGSGLVFNERVSDEKQFVRLVKSLEYGLIIDDAVIDASFFKKEG